MMGLCYFLIGTLVFLMKPHEQASWIFFLFTTITGLYMAFLYKIGKMTPFFLETAQIFFYTFTPAVFIHLAFNFPKERNLVLRYPYTNIIPYFASAFLFLRIRSLTPVMTDVPKTWLMVLVIYMATGILLFLGSCLQLWLTSKSEIVKLRSKLILLGMAISVSIPLIDLLSSALLKLYIIPGFNYYIPFFIVFPLSIGYSIVKHDLFDFDAIIKRTYGYVLTTGAIAGVYGLFVLVSDVVFGRFEITKSPLFPLVFILGGRISFQPHPKPCTKIYRPGILPPGIRLPGHRPQNQRNHALFVESG